MQQASSIHVASREDKARVKAASHVSLLYLYECLRMQGRSAKYHPLVILLAC